MKSLNWFSGVVTESKHTAVPALGVMNQTI
jgi:hypothetical protein